MTGQLFLQYNDSLHFFSTGGPIMLPLMLISLVMWALIIERLFLFAVFSGKTSPSTPLERCLFH